jgi:hypothetical protein
MVAALFVVLMIPVALVNVLLLTIIIKQKKFVVSFATVVIEHLVIFKTALVYCQKL